MRIFVWVRSKCSAFYKGVKKHLPCAGRKKISSALHYFWCAMVVPVTVGLWANRLRWSLDAIYGRGVFLRPHHKEDSGFVPCRFCSLQPASMSACRVILVHLFGTASFGKQTSVPQKYNTAVRMAATNGMCGSFSSGCLQWRRKAFFLFIGEIATVIVLKTSRFVPVLRIASMFRSDTFNMNTINSNTFMTRTYVIRTTGACLYWYCRY